MNILFANNHNYIRGGAEKVYFDEIHLLEQSGYNVKSFSYNDENSLKYNHSFSDNLNGFNMNNFQKLKNVFWNKEAYTQIKKLIKRDEISIFHGHNIHTRLSPSIVLAAKELGLKTFITLHDLKYVCPHYSMLHNYKICEECIGGKYYNAILNKCHKGSYIKSSIVAAELYNFTRLKLNEHVDCFIAPSRFIERKYKEMGFSGKIVYIPNFIIPQNFLDTVIHGSNYLFVGRLSYEKGLNVLLKAFKSNMHKLDIVGDGPMRIEIEKYIEANNMSNRVKLHGHVTSEKVLEFVRSSRALILPSETYENAPISILEALSYGKIAIGSNLGGIPEMIIDGKNGFLFEAGSVSGLNKSIQKCELLSKVDRKQFSEYSLNIVNTIFSPEEHLKSLIKLYKSEI